MIRLNAAKALTIHTLEFVKNEAFVGRGSCTAFDHLECMAEMMRDRLKYI